MCPRSGVPRMDRGSGCSVCYTDDKEPRRKPVEWKALGREGVILDGLSLTHCKAFKESRRRVSWKIIHHRRVPWGRHGAWLGGEFGGRLREQ